MLSSLDVFLLVTIIILIIILYILKRRRKSKFVNIYNTYRYKESEFPLNIYFTSETQASVHFNLLYDAVRDAVFKFNASTDFQFFVMNENVLRKPNVLTFQIACGTHTGCISSFDDSGGILAHATFPPYRKVCIDCKDILYKPLYLVIMHELGHIIGLEHTNPPLRVKSLMNAYINNDLTGFTEYDLMYIRNTYSFLR